MVIDEDDDAKESVSRLYKKEDDDRSDQHVSNIEQNIEQVIITQKPTLTAKAQEENILEREPSSRICKNHPLEALIGDVHDQCKTREALKINYCQLIGYRYFISTVEPKLMKKALEDEYLVMAM